MNRRGVIRETRVLCGFALVFMLFSSSFQLSASQSQTHGKDFISWDDIKVDDHGARLSVRDDINGNRVIIVDQNGGGDSLTVQGAVDMVTDYNTQRVKIFILPGIYSSMEIREKVIVPITKPYVSLIGNESHASHTIISWSNKASDTDDKGVPLGTFRSASVTVESDYFCASGITFENTVVAHSGGIGMQAVALRVSSNKAFFYKVRVLGSQDTLLDEKGSHYFYRCHIQGNVDFIFGKARSLFQDCSLQSTAKRAGAIAAHHRDSPDDDTGFSFVGCVVKGTGKILLGRAWGNYSRVIYSFCKIGDIITPTGWSDWNQPYRQKTAFFAEYSCTGKGADTSHRVPWLKAFTYEEVRPFLGMEFIGGQKWLRL